MNRTPQQIRAERVRKRRQQLLQERTQHLQQKAQQAEERAQAQARPNPPKPKATRNQLASGANNLGWHPGAIVVERFDKTAYLIGGGPSLERFNWKLLDETKFVVGINRAYEVLPNAQVIYFTDDDWYALHKKQGLLEHKGVKIKGSLNPNRMGNDTAIRQMHLTGERGLETTPNKLKHGRNSPYAAITICSSLAISAFFSTSGYTSGRYK